MADAMDKLLYQVYIYKGGKLSYSDWLAAGKPQADGGKPPKDTGVSATVTPPQPSPPTPKPPQVPKVNPVTGEITYVDDPSWLLPPPTTPTTPPTAAAPLDPAFKTWLQGIYSPAQIAEIEKDGITRGQGKVAWDYYQKHVAPLPEGQHSQLDPDFRAWLVKQYGEQIARSFDLADANDPQLKALRDYYNTSIAPSAPPAPSKLDPGFRAWLVKQYGEDVAAYYDQVDYRDAGLTELRNYYNTNISPTGGPTGPSESDKLAREKYEEDKRRYEEERRRREYLEQVERDRQQAEAKNKEWMLQYDIQREASESAIQKQQNELELIRGRAFPFGDELGRRVQGAKDMSGAFESARQSILASLSSPADWIKRWEVQNAPNPYTAQTQASPLEQKSNQFNQTSARAGAFDRMAAESEKLVAQLSSNQDYGAGTPNEATVLTQARNDAVMYRQAAAAEREKLGAYQKDLDYLNAQPQSEAPVAQERGSAPAPAWLPMFAPGQRAGQAITRENVATPSAQQWAGTPWSVQQGLSGYLDWAGYRPMADVLGNMAQMLPYSPGGGARWSPAIGR